MTISTTKIELLIKELTRRMDAFQKAQDLAVGDRNILEDILLRIEALERATHMSREKAGEVQKDLKADINEMKGSVENKVDDVQKILSDKEMVIVPKEKFSIIKKLLRKKAR